MATIKQYMDLANLTSYDALIKQYVSDEDAASYKTILLSADEESVYFYKDADATLSDTPDFTLSIVNNGTAVTLNGVDKSGSTASFYAPTNAGSVGQVLMSNGSGAPTWGTMSGYAPAVDTENDQLVFTTGSQPIVDDSTNAIIFN